MLSVKVVLITLGGCSSIVDRERGPLRGERSNFAPSTTMWSIPRFRARAKVGRRTRAEKTLLGFLEGSRMIYVGQDINGKVEDRRTEVGLPDIVMKLSSWEYVQDL